MRLSLLLAAMLIADHAMSREFSASRSVIPLEVSAPENSAGGLIAADVDDDGARELLVTAPGYIGAYTAGGSRLWSKQIDVCVGGQSESDGLPGHHGPGVQAGGINGDGKAEVVFLDRQSAVHVLRGNDGQALWSAGLQPPEGAECWEHVVIANLRGKGDRDLLVQASNAHGYRMGRYIAAHAVESLQQGENAPLWRRDDFVFVEIEETGDGVRLR